MKEVRLFEAFAGMGAQKKAIDNIKEKHLFKDIDVVSSGMSEWFIQANVAYYHIHNKTSLSPMYLTHDRGVTLNELNEYLINLGLSSDSKNPLKESTILSMKESQKRKLYNVMKANKNFGSVKNLSWKNFPKSDILTYSFPCTDLSIVGKMNGLSRGDNTRSGLLWEIERLLLELNENKKDYLPRFLLMENVPMLLSKKTKPEFDKFCKELEDMGYYNTILDLNSMNFNVPQSRRRIFMVSELNGKTPIEVNSTTPNLDTLNVDGFLKTSNMDVNNQEYIIALLKDTPIRRKMTIKLKSHSSKILYPNEKTFTITTKQDRLPNSGIVPFNHNIDGYLQYRFLTPRECMQLMGFDYSDYDFVKENLSKTTIYLLAGNSIVVNILEEIFKAILKRY